MEELTLELERIRAAAPGVEPEAEGDRGMFWINLPKEALRPALTTLRDDPELDYRMLSDLFGADYPARAQRFDVVGVEGVAQIPELARVLGRVDRELAVVAAVGRDDVLEVDLAGDGAGRGIEAHDGLGSVAPGP